MKNLNVNSLKSLSKGQQASFSKTITDSDIALFIAISGDTNPVHINNDYAKTTIFKNRIAHGMLVASLISNILGTKLPGPGAIYLSQNLNFINPVYINDTITAVVKVEKIDTIKDRVLLSTICYNQNNKVVIDGNALIKIPV